MATISKLAINLGWNGQQAEDGLSRTAKKTSEAGKKADEAGGAFGRLAAQHALAHGVHRPLPLRRRLLAASGLAAAGLAVGLISHSRTPPGVIITFPECSPRTSLSTASATPVRSYSA